MPRTQTITNGRMGQPERVDFLDGRVVYHSEISPLAKASNEDALWFGELSGRRGVLAVADGAGGMPGADKASRLALEALEAALRGAGRRDRLRNAILDGIEAANRQILELGIGAATTLSIVELDEGVGRTYHVGDSPILVVNAEGDVRQLTMAHSPVGYAVESGFLDEEEAMVHEERHLLSNCVGVENMWIEVGAPFEIGAGDTILLASDGLFDNLHVAEVAGELASEALLDGVERMLGETRMRMREPREGSPSKPDDLTLLAFRA